MCQTFGWLTGGKTNYLVKSSNFFSQIRNPSRRAGDDLPAQPVLEGGLHRQQWDSLDHQQWRCFPIANIVFLKYIALNQRKRATRADIKILKKEVFFFVGCINFDSTFVVQAFLKMAEDLQINEVIIIEHNFGQFDFVPVSALNNTIILHGCKVLFTSLHCTMCCL